MKITVVNRKHAGYLTNPKLTILSLRNNLNLYNDTQVEMFVMSAYYNASPGFKEHHRELQGFIEQKIEYLYIYVY